MDKYTDLRSLEKAIIPLVDEDLEITFTSAEQLRLWLIEQIGELIDRDFPRLLWVLYRIDVEEAKVKRLIAENEGDDAAAIIADLIIERQMKKIESRKKFTPGKSGKYFEDQ